MAEIRHNSYLKGETDGKSVSLDKAPSLCLKELVSVPMQLKNNYAVGSVNSIDAEIQKYVEQYNASNDAGHKRTLKQTIERLEKQREKLCDVSGKAQAKLSDIGVSNVEVIPNKADYVLSQITEEIREESRIPLRDANNILLAKLDRWGKPNSEESLRDELGIKQKRVFGNDGGADLDIDYRHHGQPSDFPHAHDWGRDENGNPVRQKRRPLTDEEKEKFIPGDDNNVPEFHDNSQSWWDKFLEDMAITTGLTGGALITYIIISEGSRLIPARNLVPVP